MPDRFVELEILFRRHRLGAHFAETLQIVGVFAIDNDRCVPGRFVHDVGRGRVFDVMQLTHVARDHEHLVGLEFHEGRRRNKAVNRDRAPADLAQDVVHLADPWNALEGDAGLEQALEINLVGVFLQEKNVLPHDEAPDRVIDRRVIVVALIDRELEKVFRKRGDSRVVHRDSAFSFHSRHFMNFMTEPAGGQAGSIL